jgi:hypothetical protein
MSNMDVALFACGSSQRDAFQKLIIATEAAKFAA